MKTVTIIGGITGVILAVFAYFAEINSWIGTDTAMALVRRICPDYHSSSLLFVILVVPGLEEYRNALKK